VGGGQSPTHGPSPLGQRKTVPIALEELATLYDEIYLNGGRRGLQIRLCRTDRIGIVNCITADLVR
jgi:Cys-tRNA(Pro)/Cys-tRNA(Cys) deacylase